MTDLNRTTPTLADYAAALRERGTPILRSSEGTFWIRYETGAMMRMPTFNVEPLSNDEVQEVLWHGCNAFVTYLLPANELHAANAWLYICSDPAYSPDKLAKHARRDVRRGFRNLRIAPLSSAELLAHGLQAFCDTRRRAGLSDGTPDEFRRRFIFRVTCGGHAFFGAWRDGQLAAFLSITEVDDWAEIEGSFSLDAFLNLTPNDALVSAALFHYLTKQKCRMVSYGLSSIQAKSNEVGLHVFKSKVGFEATPVHRVFEVHPLIRPFISKATLWTFKQALNLVPRHRRLKKVEGMLACMLGENHSHMVVGGNPGDDNVRSKVMCVVRNP
jgi:hypothetical protein